MEKVNMHKIAAVITLYNPDENIIPRVNSLQPFITKIFLIDNSENLNSDIFNYYKDNPKVKFVFNGRNLGIAASMNLAIKFALEEDYKFLLTMDQDSEFDNKSLATLLTFIRNDKTIGIYSPFHKNKFFTKSPSIKSFEEVSDVMTSGNILNLDIVKEVGYFREDYFIDYVDIEYCFRLRNYGYKILQVNNSILVHNEANLSRKKFLWKVVYPPNHNPFRWYYKIRNYFYLKNEYKKKFPEYFRSESRNIRNNIIKVLLYENKKFLKLKFALKGYLDFIKKITGRMN
jgi:rhamnosyltransferase